MKKIYCLIFLCASHFISFAGNVAGGDIAVNCITGDTRQFTITIWGNHFSANDSLRFYFGDNTLAAYSNQNAFSFTGLAPGYPNDSAIKWVFTHVYPGPGNYSVTAFYTSRDTGIMNIPNSCNTNMVLTTNFTIDPNIGCNSSPYLTNAHLIEWLTLSTNFTTNFGAFDAEGDSLAYRIGPCMDTSGIISGYTYPNVLAGGNFSINAITGDLSWNSPGFPGKYNVLVYIEEWKLFSNGQRYLIETVMRELQLDVESGVGINEQDSPAFSFFPNPVLSNDELHLHFARSGDYLLKIFDAEGKNVFENSVFCQKEQIINLPSLSPGIYFLRISDDTDVFSSRKLLIDHP